MNLGQWLSTLRAAARPLDLVELRTGADRIAARAAALSGNRVSFLVSMTGTGVRITATPPSPFARRALDRAVEEQMDEIRGALATQARERLTGG